MPSPHRLPLLLALALGVAAPAVPAVASATTHPSAPRQTTTSDPDDEADELLLGVPLTWTLRGSTIRGTITSDDRSDVGGTAKIVREAGGRATTFATGGRLAVPAGGRQTLKLVLTKAGTRYFRRHRTATVQLVLHEDAGDRSGITTEEIRIRKAS